MRVRRRGRPGRGAFAGPGGCAGVGRDGTDAQGCAAGAGDHVRTTNLSTDDYLHLLPWWWWIWRLGLGLVWSWLRRRLVPDVFLFGRWLFWHRFLSSLLFLRIALTRIGYAFARDTSLCTRVFAVDKSTGIVVAVNCLSFLRRLLRHERALRASINNDN